jgi:hypothetical protein
MHLIGWQRAFANIVPRSVGFALFMVLGTFPLPSATLVRLSLNDMINESTAIVRGTVTGSYAAYQGRVIYTHYTVQVTEQMKGNTTNVADIAIPGGKLNGVQQWFAGTPQLPVGGDFVLFLWTGQSGLTQIIGLTQGLFTVSSTDPSNVTATRPASQEVLLDPATGRQVEDQALSYRLTDLRSQVVSTLGGGAQ